MSVKVKLMQKNGIMVMNLAKEFINYNVGERICTVAKYSEKYDTARGTIQSALKFLQQNRAIDLDARGHLGTFLTFINYERLLEFADIKAIVGVMPLPYSKLYEGLATGLYKTFLSNKLPSSIAYMRGANSRLDALQAGRYDFAVISKLAADYSINEGANIEIVMNFGQYTYVKEHALIFNKPSCSSIINGMKIGIDRTSIDHYLLTLSQCEGKKVELIDLPYNQIVAKVLCGDLDAAVWNIDEINERKIDIKYYALENDKFHKEDTEAVMVVDKYKSEISSILKNFLNKDEILVWQNKVLTGEITPNY